MSLDRRTDCYGEILAALDRQSVSLSGHEVIWVDADDTPAADQSLREAGRGLQRRINLRFFWIERGGHAGARNFGIRQARLSRAFTQGYRAAKSEPQELSSVGSAQLGVKSPAKAG